MKLYYLFFIVPIALCTNLSATIVGTLLEQVELGECVSKLSPITFVRDSLDYTEGGITFTYAAGIFTEAPCVRITVELLNAMLTFTDAYVATVTYNDAVATGVVAKHIMFDLIEEASTDSVKIHLAAGGR